MAKTPERRFRSVRRATRAACVGLLLAGCTTPANKPVQRYPVIPIRQVPGYLTDTIFQYTDLTGTEPDAISGYGLVANLNGTGGSRAPTPVRDYIIKDISRHNLGVHEGADDESPDRLLTNHSFAIVRVDALIPPGARAGTDWWTWFDVHVSALPESDTTSLEHGDLYETDLKVDGANPLDPGGEHVAVMAQATGSLFVNPAYALDSSDSAPARRSRRNAIVIGGARPLQDRPLVLRLRTPERRLARAIERRINEQFQDVVDDDLRVKHVATAEDEGRVTVYVPRFYSTDVNHFIGLLKHLYLRGGEPDYAALKAQELATVAVSPNAPLGDISYAWEALGKPALHAVQPLESSADPAVQYAAARAAAFIGDPAAVPTLLAIARTASSPFRVPAVQALGQLPRSPMVDSMLRSLLDSDQALVRIEAYKVLARHEDLENPDDGPIFTHIVKRGESERFIVDVIRCGGPPLVYASRQGIPRLAIFGNQTAIDLPVLFMSMQDRFSISSTTDGAALTLFYRGAELRKPIVLQTPPNLAEVAARLGGEGAPGDPSLDFSYSDVVSLVQSLAKGQKVIGWNGEQKQQAAFVLQDASSVEQAVENAPMLRDNGRPNGGQAAPVAPTRPENTAAVTPPPDTPAGTDDGRPHDTGTSMLSPGSDVLGLDAAGAK